MGLWLLANTVARDAAEIRVTDNTNVQVADSEAEGIGVIRGGPRSLKWTQSGTDARRIVYVNRSGLGTATHCVIVDAVLHEGETIHVWGWDDYAASGSAMHGAAPTPLVGIDQTDWVFELTTSFPDAEAFGVNFPSGYEKTVRQIYFCNGLDFDHAVGPVQFTRVPVHSPAVQHCGHYFKLHATASITLGPITRAKLETFNSLPLHDVVFLYDDTGSSEEGDHIPHKLWQCIVIGQESTVAYQDNTSELLFLDLELGLLKHGDG